MYPARDQRFPIVQRTDGFLLSIAWLATGCTWLNAVDIPGAETMDRDVSMRDASPDAKIRDGATDAADANPWNWPDWHFDAGPLTNHPDDSSGPDAPDPTCTTHPELCGCGDGFEDDDAGVCVDIDECERGLASCGPLASCLNTDGSSRCRCDSYYDDVNGDGSSCVDGHLRSAHAFGGLGINLGYAVAYDDDANLFLTGSYDQSIAFQSEAHTAQGSFDMYLTKFDPSMQAL